MTQPLKLRWVLAHIPYDLFLRSANAFAKAIKEKTNGSIEIEVMGKDEWVQKYNNGEDIGNVALMRRLVRGEIEMSQTYSTVLGHLNKDYFVFDMPFLFRDHDHAAKVLDGEVGQQILEGLTPSGARGLAFTYSGGYKMLATNKKVDGIEDLKGMTLRCGGSPVSEATFRAIGAEPLALGVDGFTASVAAGECEGGENVFPRYFRSQVNTVTNTVANTEHALFLTSIVISKKVWDQLTSEQQEIIKECAQIAAREEREESLKDGAAAQERCAKEGIEVVEWSDEAIGQFKDAIAPLYDRFADYFSDKDILNKIKNH
jgi:TRAP-type C4-dicarboxylate transport system substrate-binding protein